MWWRTVPCSKILINQPVTSYVLCQHKLGDTFSVTELFRIETSPDSGTTASAALQRTRPCRWSRWRSWNPCPQTKRRVLHLLAGGVFQNWEEDFLGHSGSASAGPWPTSPRRSRSPKMQLNKKILSARMAKKGCRVDPVLLRSQMVRSNFRIWQCWSRYNQTPTMRLAFYQNVVKRYWKLLMSLKSLLKVSRYAGNVYFYGNADQNTVRPRLKTLGFFHKVIISLYKIIIKLLMCELGFFLQIRSIVSLKRRFKSCHYIVSRYNQTTVNNNVSNNNG